MSEKSLENNVGEGENASNQNILLFLYISWPFKDKSRTVINSLSHNPDI